jgi:hypothetical protein
MAVQERPETPRGAVDSDQEPCKEHLFTAKFRDCQRSQKGKERKESRRETIMRILRMRYIFSTNPRGFSFCTYIESPRTRPSRPNTSEFITQELQILGTMQVEQEQHDRQLQMRGAQRPGGLARIPEVPAVPEIPP